MTDHEHAIRIDKFIGHMQWLRVPNAKIMDMSVTLWRYPTPAEIMFGQDAIRYLDVLAIDVLNADGHAKSWCKIDGERCDHLWYDYQGVTKCQN